MSMCITLYRKKLYMQKDTKRYTLERYHPKVYFEWGVKNQREV